MVAMRVSKGSDEMVVVGIVRVASAERGHGSGSVGVGGWCLLVQVGASWCLFSVGML